MHEPGDHRHPQIRLAGRGTCWEPLVEEIHCRLLCEPSDVDELFVEIDGHELSVRDFARMVSAGDGKSVRVVFDLFRSSDPTAGRARGRLALAAR